MSVSDFFGAFPTSMRSQVGLSLRIHIDEAMDSTVGTGDTDWGSVYMLSIPTLYMGYTPYKKKGYRLGDLPSTAFFKPRVAG